MLSAVVLVLVATAASAQEAGVPQAPPQEGPPGRQGPGPGRGNLPFDAGMTPGEIQKIFDGYLIVQVKDALSLSDQQFAQLIPRITQLQAIRRRHLGERMRIMNELQRLSRPNLPKTDDAALKERLTALQEIDARFAADVRKAYSTVDELLDLRQQARFRVFEEGLERKKLDLLLRARQNRPIQRQQ